jgi:hypothetical protein
LEVQYLVIIILKLINIITITELQDTSLDLQTGKEDSETRLEFHHSVLEDQTAQAVPALSTSGTTTNIRLWH